MQQQLKQLIFLCQNVSKWEFPGIFKFFLTSLPKERKLDIEVARKIFITRAKARILGTKMVRRGMEYSYSLEQKTTNGTTVGLDMSGQAFSLGNDDNNRLFSFSLNRPLLQNFGKQTTGINIDIKTIEYEASLELFKHELNQFIQDLSVFYFELFFARENLRIQEQALERALKQYEDTKKDIESGVIPEQEIFLVEENVVNFEIKKESALPNAWDKCFIVKAEIMSDLRASSIGNVKVRLEK